MKAVQFDQNLNSRKFASQCSSQKVVEAKLLPKSLKNMKDDQLLPELISRGNLIVTNDLAITEAYQHLIPTKHPGIVIVDVDDDDHRTMTWRIAASVLNTFKAEFPGWHSTPWENSAVTLQPSFVAVKHFENGMIVVDDFIPRADANWQDRLTSVLESNATLAFLGS